MKATIDGVTYEGTVDEIRDIVENPPARPERPEVNIRIQQVPPGPLWPSDFPRNWDGSPKVTC